MIIRSRPTVRDLMFTVRGSILPRIAGPLLLILAVSLGASLVGQLHPALLSRFSAMPFTLIGLSLSIFMSFRNTACYERWWEARRLWGQLIIACRSFARQSAGIEAQDRALMLRALAGFTASLAARLRDQDEAAACARHLEADLPAGTPNVTDAVLSLVGRRCRELARDGQIEAIHYSVLETQLTELGHVQGGCERIKSTPLPFSYSLMLHRVAYVFCLLLPFALAPALGWWTPLPAVLISYAFFGLDALGDELTDPFGADLNDLPLDAIVRAVEREMLHAAGADDLPPPVAATGYVLR